MIALLKNQYAVTIWPAFSLDLFKLNNQLVNSSDVLLNHYFKIKIIFTKTCFEQLYVDVFDKYD